MANGIEAQDLNVWSGIEDLLRKWQKRARESQFSHYKAGSYFQHLHLWLGIPVVVLTTCVGTTVFATLQKQLDIGVQIGVGAVSVLAAVLAGLQTFLRFGDLAGKHHSVGSQYGSARRRIEAILVLPQKLRGDPKQLLDEIRTTLDSLSEAAPEVPKRIWNQLLTDFEEQP